MRQWLEMVKEAQDTRWSGGTEQQCNVCRQVVAVVDRGEVGQRRRDGGGICLLFACCSVAEQDRRR